MLAFLSWLTEFSLRRAAVVVLVVIALFAAGLLVARQIKLELFPDIDYPAMVVATTYPGAAPQDVVDGVSKPIERAASTLPGLKRMQTVSSEGLSIVLLEFGYGTDMEKRQDELYARLRDTSFPATVATPQITLINVQMIPVTELSLAGDLPVEELERIAQEQIVPEFTKIDGVLQVEVIGGAVPEVDVVLDSVKLREMGLSSYKVATAIGASNTAIPSGFLTSKDQTVPLRTLSSIDSLEELENLVVGTGPASPEGDGAPTPILLKDVAEVSLGRSTTAGAARTNGQPSVAIVVSKSAEANTVQVANGISDAVERLQEEIGDEAQILTVFDQSRLIERSIAGMLREGGWGALFAVVVVFLFLLSLRSTFITAISIPLSVVVALLLMYWLGFTLNVFTLGGLTIAIGRVIDDSIVVLENIYRHVRQEGEDIGSAVRSAPREVASAITSSTLTTVAVFLPLGLIGGLTGELFRPFGFTVTFALLASLAAALMVVPVLARSLIGRGPAKPAGDTWLQRGYTPMLRWCLGHRVITLAVAMALFAISLVLLRSVPVSLLPRMTENVFDVTVIAPAGSDVDSILFEAAKAEEVLAEIPDVTIYETVVGGQTQSLVTLSAALAGRGFSSARIYTRVRDGANLDQVADDARERMKGIATNSIIAVSDMQTSTFSRLQVTAWGDDAEALAEAGQEILAAAAKVDGVANLTSDVARERPEIAIDVDPNKAALSGLSANDVAAHVQSLLVGQTVTQMQLEDGRAVDVRLSLAGEGVEDVESLGQLLVGSEAVPLSSIAEVREISAPAQVSRVDGRPAVTISGDIVAKDTGSVARKVEGDINDLELPKGVEVEVGGILSQIEESFNSMYVGIGLAIVLVYIVMVIFFGSLLEPFVILFSLPMATIGAFFALFITERTLSLSGMIGLLMLVGIVVTNAIVLMDLVKHLMQRGLDTHDALIQGGRIRVRPILMTALATMLALVPLAMGLHQGAIIAAELATVVIGGLFTSTFLTLVVVPVVYSLLQDLRRGPSARRPVKVRAKPPAEEEGETSAPRFQRLRRTPKEKE